MTPLPGMVRFAHAPALDTELWLARGSFGPLMRHARQTPTFGLLACKPYATHKPLWHEDETNAARDPGRGERGRRRRGWQSVASPAQLSDNLSLSLSLSPLFGRPTCSSCRHSERAGSDELEATNTSRRANSGPVPGKSANLRNPEANRQSRP